MSLAFHSPNYSTEVPQNPNTPLHPSTPFSNAIVKLTPNPDGADALLATLLSPTPGPTHNKIEMVFCEWTDEWVYCIDLNGTYTITADIDTFLAATDEIAALEEKEQEELERKLGS